MINIPRTMSTQHPDNVSQPFFTENTLLGGEDEVQEAFYAFSHLDCDEQMWDFEGKEVDNFVVKKLLTKNENFFRHKKLGRDVRLTFRVPNPEVEQAEAKILLETLESIPRSYDAAKLFYGEDISPVFEVILPMTTSVESLNRIYYYYKNIVAGKQSKEVSSGDVTIGEWIGEFKPEMINVIPLFEDKENLLRSAEIVKQYIKNKDLEYQRVFLARSDPAVNYGNLSAVLMNKIALQRLHKLSEETGVKIYPILGVGSAPFRGNLRPETTGQILKGYPSVQTFSIQSSFKFDNRPEVVKKSIDMINNGMQGVPMPVDEEKVLQIIEKYTAEYQKQLHDLVAAINKVSVYIPKRRKRKLHVGLFGYSRSFDEFKLPRAITFTASLYSLGIPPELLAINSLTNEDINVLETCYSNFKYDILSSMKYYNPDSSFVPEGVRQFLKKYLSKAELSSEHKELTSYIAKVVSEGSTQDLSDQVLRAAQIRKFLG